MRLCNRTVHPRPLPFWHRALLLSSCCARRHWATPLGFLVAPAVLCLCAELARHLCCLSSLLFGIWFWFAVAMGKPPRISFAVQALWGLSHSPSSFSCQALRSAFRRAFRVDRVLFLRPPMKVFSNFWGSNGAGPPSVLYIVSAVFSPLPGVVPILVTNIREVNSSPQSLFAAYVATISNVRLLTLSGVRELLVCSSITISSWLASCLDTAPSFKKKVQLAIKIMLEKMAISTASS